MAVVSGSGAYQRSYDFAQKGLSSHPGLGPQPLPTPPALPEVRPPGDPPILLEPLGGSYEVRGLGRFGVPNAQRISTGVVFSIIQGVALPAYSKEARFVFSPEHMHIASRLNQPLDARL